MSRKHSLQLDGPVDLQTSAYDIARRFGLEPVVEVKRLAGGVMTSKYMLRCSDKTCWIVRFYPMSRAEILGFEPDLIRLCHAKGLAVAEVLGDSRSDRDALLPYVVYRMIPGIPLSEHMGMMSPSDMRELAQRIAAFLFSFAEIQVEGWGEPVDVWHARSPSWMAFLEQAFGEGNAANLEGLLGKDRVLQLTGIWRDIGRFPPPSLPRLAWSDLSPENIIVNDDGTLSGFVDFEGTLVAEPLLSLGYLRARAPLSPFYQALISAWPGGLGIADRERIDLYAVVRALRLMKYAAQPLPTGLPRTPVDAYLPGSMEALVALANPCDKGV